MNERIKELIAQCSFTVTEYSMGIDSSYEDFDKELFAELIIKECMSLTGNFENRHHSKNATERIAEYFGVKE